MFASSELQHSGQSVSYRQASCRLPLAPLPHCYYGRSRRQASRSQAHPQASLTTAIVQKESVVTGHLGAAVLLAATKMTIHGRARINSVAKVRGLGLQVHAAESVDSTCTEEARRKAAVLSSLASTHLPMMPKGRTMHELQFLHEDPPVLSVPNFWSREQCQSLIETTCTSAVFNTSRVDDADPQAVAGRTSRSLVLTPEVAATCGSDKLMQQLMDDLSDKLGIGSSLHDDPRAAATAAAAVEGLTCELPQLVHYQRGQRYDCHEDALPAARAGELNYQRRATVLLYLNDVKSGGATAFESLGSSGLKVTPCCGTALVFFPSFADGRPDERTLHAAEEAVDEKWIVQVWIGAPIADSH